MRFSEREQRFLVPRHPLGKSTGYLALPRSLLLSYSTKSSLLFFKCTRFLLQNVSRKLTVWGNNSAESRISVALWKCSVLFYFQLRVIHFQSNISTITQLDSFNITWNLYYTLCQVYFIHFGNYKFSQPCSELRICPNWRGYCVCVE